VPEQLDQPPPRAQKVIARRLVNRTDDAPTAAAEAAAAGAATTVTPAEFAVATTFPYDNDVTMTMSWAAASVSSVAVSVRLRVPSWIVGPAAAANLSVVRRPLRPFWRPCFD
jgi:hypothetical protein